MKYIYGVELEPLVKKKENDIDEITIFDGSGVIGFQSNGETQYLLKDHLGSTRLVVDGSGEKLSEFDYDDYGETIEKGESSKIEYRYTGQEWDEELQQYNYIAREYDPKVGRFNSIDPVREGFSSYSYVDNNPINFVDNDGMVKTSFTSDSNFNFFNKRKINNNIASIDKNINTMNKLYSDPNLNKKEFDKLENSFKKVFGEEYYDQARVKNDIETLKNGFDSIKEHEFDLVRGGLPSNGNAQSMGPGKTRIDVGQSFSEDVIFHEYTHGLLNTVDVMVKNNITSAQGPLYPKNIPRYRDCSDIVPSGHFERLGKKDTMYGNASHWQSVYSDYFLKKDITKV